MKVRRVVKRRLRRRSSGVNVVSDVNAVVAANIGEGDGTDRTSSSQHVTIVQRGGRRATGPTHRKGGSG